MKPRNAIRRCAMCGATTDYDHSPGCTGTTPGQRTAEVTPIARAYADLALAARCLLMVAGDNNTGLDQTGARCVADLKVALSAIDALPGPGTAEATPSCADDLLAERVDQLDEICTWLQEAGDPVGASMLHKARDRFLLPLARRSAVENERGRPDVMPADVTITRAEHEALLGLAASVARVRRTARAAYPIGIREWGEIVSAHAAFTGEPGRERAPPSSGQARNVFRGNVVAVDLDPPMGPSFTVRCSASESDVAAVAGLMLKPSEGPVVVAVPDSLFTRKEEGSK